MPRSAVLRVADWWALSNIFLMRVICNIKVEFRGVEKIPRGPLIVASKHQSMWETISLLRFFEAPFFVIKRELKFIPIFGLFMIKTDMVAIDRSKGGRALLAVLRRAEEEVRRGRQFVIFPEGTRTAPGAPPQYKAGVGMVYVDCGVPVLPVALNSGLFWPRRTFMRYPGTLVVEFLDPIPPGLTRDEFLTRVENVIEEATNRIVAVAQAEQKELFGGIPQRGE
jgi:1-acyl-sn-glycerol-3-phosphate acyltransferase